MGSQPTFSRTLLLSTSSGMFFINFAVYDLQQYNTMADTYSLPSTKKRMTASPNLSSTASKHGYSFISQKRHKPSSLSWRVNQSTSTQWLHERAHVFVEAVFILRKDLGKSICMRCSNLKELSPPLFSVGQKQALSFCNTTFLQILLTIYYI